MATITKRRLSGSTNGRQVKIAATTTPGTAIHTAVAGTSDENNYDEIWIWAVNSDTTARKLTIEFGGATSPDDLIEQTVPAEAGYMAIVPGLILQNAVSVAGFAAAANVVMVAGFVNRIAA